MTKTLRIFCLLLVCCLVFGMLAACGGSGANTDSSAETSSEDDGIFDLDPDVFGSDPDESEPSGGANGTDSKAKDTKSSPTTSKGGKTPEYEQLLPAEVAKQPKYVQDAYKKLPDIKTDDEKKLHILHYSDKAEQLQLLGYKYGIQIEYTVVPWGEQISKYVQMVNGGKSPDILEPLCYNFQLISKKYVQAWDDYININTDPFWKDCLSVNANFTVGGKHFMFIPNDNRNGRSQMLCVYNVKRFRDARLETPSELFDKGEWDWAALEKAAEKLTTAPDKFGLWMYNGPQAFVNSTGHDYIDFVGGRPKNMVNSAPVARAMQAYSRLVSKKVFTTATDDSVLRKQFDNGNLAMVIGNMDTVYNRMSQIEKGQFEFTAFPKDPEADKYYLPQNYVGPYLAKGAKHPRNAAAYIYVRNIMSDDTYRREFNKEESRNGRGLPESIYDAHENIKRKTTPVAHTWDMFGNELAVCISCIGANLNAGEPWSKIAAGLSPVADAGIKNFYGK